MRRALTAAGAPVDLTRGERLIHVPREGVSEYVDLYATNRTAERRTVRVTFGGRVATLRVQAVQASPAYGDVLCDHQGPVGVFLSASRRADVYGAHPIAVRDGRVTGSPGLRVGDVLCVDAGGESLHAVVVHAGVDVSTEPALPDGQYADWRRFSRMESSNYRPGPGVLGASASGGELICTAPHAVVGGDRIVVEVGGTPRLVVVDAVRDGTVMSVSGCSPGWQHAPWWHLPSGLEIDVALISEDDTRRLVPSTRLSVSDTDYFDGSSLAQVYADLVHPPAIATVAEEGRMEITLRPHCERVRLIPGICLGLDRFGILSCSADREGAVAVHGAVNATDADNKLILR